MTFENVLENLYKIYQKNLRLKNLILSNFLSFFIIIRFITQSSVPAYCFGHQQLPTSRIVLTTCSLLLLVYCCITQWILIQCN